MLPNVKPGASSASNESRCPFDVQSFQFFIFACIRSFGFSSVVLPSTTFLSLGNVISKSALRAAKSLPLHIKKQPSSGVTMSEGALNVKSKSLLGSLTVKSLRSATVPPSGIRLSGLMQRRGAPNTRISFSVTSVSPITNVPMRSIVAYSGVNFILVICRFTGEGLYFSGICKGKPIGPPVKKFSALAILWDTSL